MSGPLNGRVAIVTGGAGGIGTAIVARLRRDGAIVMATDHAVGDGADIAHDVMSADDWRRVAALAQARSGRLDIVVNNAGLASAPLAAEPSEMPLEHWRRLQAVNFEGSVLGCQIALPLLRRSPVAAIVNNASLASMTATPFDPAYGAAKAAIAQFTRSFAVEAARPAPHRVRCNSIHPGLIATPMTAPFVAATAAAAGVSEAEMRAQFTARIPLGRFGAPEDVADAVAFLVSDDARYITSQTLIIDGGMSGQ
jgi:NAD(P)-dependent dehydrogenase (short-subunit alcohol dehydrogenase family)